MKLTPTLRNVAARWRSLIIILVPLLLLPLAVRPEKESRCGYVVLTISVFWMTEAVPLPVTSLLPVVLFPLLGVLSTEDICIAYLKETTMMFIGGLIVAIAVEHCNLHKRIALKVLLLIGTSPRKLMLGFMLTTMFLSMWISNTASTAMMTPIARAVLDELKSRESETDRDQTFEMKSLGNIAKKTDVERRRLSTNDEQQPSREEISYFLGIAYAANVGGTGTLTGTGTNLTFKGLFEGIFPDAEGLNFARWMIFNVPLMLLNGLFAWLWLQILFLDLFRKKNLKTSPERSKAVGQLIGRSYDELGPITYHEASVLVLFLLVVFLWFFRKPEFIPGWANIYDDVVIDDATAAAIVVFLLFVLPANLNFIKTGDSKPTPALLEWKIVHEKVSWGLVFLLGGGFAMAAASKASGLSRYLGSQLTALEMLSPFTMLVIICVATTFLTEVSSNAAVANILLPVLAEMSTAIRIHPLYLMLPATLSCSYAFMLPVATPSNAIVVASSSIRTLDMMKAGIGMNLICCASLIISFSTFGASLYDLREFPDFAQNYLNTHNASALYNGKWFYMTFVKMKFIVGLKYIFTHWKFIVIVLVPLVFLPLVLQGTKELKCAYVVCIMASYWMTEVIPLPVTSLLPVLLFPLLGVESTKKVCVTYLKETNMMFIGGLIVAIAVEHSKLHMRIALKVLLMMGTSPKRLLLGFMTTTMFLSMWISNTATTAMMMPILIAVLDTLKEYQEDGDRRPSLTLTAGVTKSRHDTGPFDQETRRTSSARIDTSSVNRPTKDQLCYFLGIAYAANIGGTGTISGSGTNLVFKGIYESMIEGSGSVNFANWMAFNVPVMLINCCLAWVWLQILFMGLLSRKGKRKTSKEQDKAVRELIRERHRALGRMTYHETNVLILFLILIALWFFRKPEFIPGWAALYTDVAVADSTAAIFVVFLLFVLPANKDYLNVDVSGRKVGKESPALLNWKIVHEKLPWGLILLMGGGFAMAEASQNSGLSDLLGNQLIGLEVLPPPAILIVMCVATTFATEVSSNTAVANIVLPVLAKLCAALGIDPLYLMLPATICCSYAFMLPVATPPNAIVMAASNMRTIEMMRAGFVMNLICVSSLAICFLTFGTIIYDLMSFPVYASKLGSRNITLQTT